MTVQYQIIEGFYWGDYWKASLMHGKPCLKLPIPLGNFSLFSLMNVFYFGFICGLKENLWSCGECLWNALWKPKADSLSGIWMSNGIFCSNQVYRYSLWCTWDNTANLGLRLGAFTQTVVMTPSLCLKYSGSHTSSESTLLLQDYFNAQRIWGYGPGCSIFLVVKFAWSHLQMTKLKYLI